jgi:hypothetical protein
MPRKDTFRPEDIGVGVMGGGQNAFDSPTPLTCDLVDLVTEATWIEALRRLGATPRNPLLLWTMLASRILQSVADGERDALRLQRFALEGLDDQDWFSEER